MATNPQTSKVNHEIAAQFTEVADNVGSPKSAGKSLEEIEQAQLAHKMSSAQSENQKVEKNKVQTNINKAAMNFIKEHTKGGGTDLVWIRAMKSHHPAPRVGRFDFQATYTNYIEGFRYVCPRYVAASLEETENAIMLQDV